MPRQIDHLVLPVHDLDGAAALYTRLGFQVGVRNRHPWGTDNRLIQFPGSFLELITVADATRIPPHTAGVFSFGAFVRDYLARREGLAMLALASDDAAADAAEFASAGIGDVDPFTFQRTGRLPDGTEMTVGFTLAFAVDTHLPEAGFFVCQQHNPAAFWNPEFQRHDNGATAISAVTLGVADPAEHDAFLRAFTGQPTGRRIDQWGGRYALANGGHLVINPGVEPQGLTGFAITVRDPDDVRRRLVAADIVFIDDDTGLIIPETEAFGCRITVIADSS